MGQPLRIDFISGIANYQNSGLMAKKQRTLFMIIKETTIDCELILDSLYNFDKYKICA